MPSWQPAHRQGLQVRQRQLLQRLWALPWSRAWRLGWRQPQMQNTWMMLARLTGPPRLEVCFWQPAYTLQLELGTSCDEPVSLLVSHQIHGMLAALVRAHALIMRFMEKRLQAQPVSEVGREKQCCVCN